MNQADHKRAALAKLLQGDARPARALRPPLIIDIDQFNGDELDAIRRYQEAHADGQDCTQPKADLDRLLAGRPLRMIPKPTNNTF